MESVYLAGKAWLLPAALWLAVGLATVWWAYRGASMDRHIRGACMGLKCLGLLHGVCFADLDKLSVR